MSKKVKLGTKKFEFLHNNSKFELKSEKFN
nr:MAG TPA: hypothetical protein [Bacteriophage sp.]DAW33625.1 MAG TPA: hypothetical protein [Bacteriophage sp.]